MRDPLALGASLPTFAPSDRRALGYVSTLARLHVVEQDRGTSVVAAAIGEWPSALEDVVLGTSDPARIVGLLDVAGALGE